GEIISPLHLVGERINGLSTFWILVQNSLKSVTSLLPVGFGTAFGTILSGSGDVFDVFPPVTWLGPKSKYPEK
ncbi:MAG: hypothetical protein ABIZ95_15780, partial [Pyrinomonadaceae bacterium]